VYTLQYLVSNLLGMMLLLQLSVMVWGDKQRNYLTNLLLGVFSISQVTASMVLWMTCSSTPQTQLWCPLITTQI